MFLRSKDLPQEPGAIAISELKALIGKSDPTILEIGANVGQTTEAFLREMPGARMFCFEPEPRAIRQFKSRIRSPNVALFECAVGNRNGTITFHQSSGEGAAKDWDQSGSIRGPKRVFEMWPWLKFESQIEVPIVRLDDWAADKNPGTVDLIWADVQGAESDVILGGADTIRNCRFFFTEYGVIEWYEGQISLDQICEAMFDLGFVLYRKFAMDALFVNKNRCDLRQFKFSITRNTLCPCGSGQKYKHCHGSLT